MKNCNDRGCVQVNPQPLTEFTKSKHSPDGKMSRCKHCNSRRNAIYRKENPEKYKADFAKWYAENSERQKAKSAKWNRENSEKSKANNAKWYAENIEKVAIKSAKRYVENLEKIRARSARWFRENSHKAAAYATKRHAAKLQRTPRWLTRDQFKEIEQVYKAASDRSKETGIEMHVDHIVPLRGKNVSGLHVPWNLQILTKAENSRKGNRHK